MIWLEHFAPEHLRTYEPGDIDREVLQTIDLPASVWNWTNKAIAAIADGRTIGIAGVAETEDGVEGWVLGSDELRKHPMTMHRLTVRGIEVARGNLGFDRLRAVVLDRPETRHWAGRLGFKRIGSKNGAIVYERVW